MIRREEFQKIDMRVGTIIAATPNKGAKKKAYKLKIDLGDFGIKNSSAQITDVYDTNDLIGKQVIVVINLNPLKIAEITSEVLVLGANTKEGVVLLTTDKPIPNGMKIY